MNCFRSISHWQAAGEISVRSNIVSHVRTFSLWGLFVRVIQPDVHHRPVPLRFWASFIRKKEEEVVPQIKQYFHQMAASYLWSQSALDSCNSLKNSQHFVHIWEKEYSLNEWYNSCQTTFFKFIHLCSHVSLHWLKFFISDLHQTVDIFECFRFRSVSFLFIPLNLISTAVLRNSPQDVISSMNVFHRYCDVFLRQICLCFLFPVVCLSIFEVLLVILLTHGTLTTCHFSYVTVSLQ